MTTRVIIEADGGSRGNPGPAGFGAVVRREDDGQVLAERSGGLGRATNNFAEYRGLIAGLRAARELGATEAEIRLDSKLVVEQMSGRWKIKHPDLQPLAREATQLVFGFVSANFRWIAREYNKHADRLANEAMDAQERGDEPDPEADRAVNEELFSVGSPAEPAPAESAPAEPARTEPAGERSGSAVRSWTGAVGSPTRLLLLRHGQSALSVDKRYSGRGDVALTELGQRQAHAAAKRLVSTEGVATPDGSAVVLSSPLARARGTAEAVVAATGGELVVHEGLVETDFGSWEGLTFTEASEQYPELHRSWLGDPSVEPPNGESLNTAFERVRGALNGILRDYAGRTVVLVTHVTPIKAVLRTALAAGPELFYRLHLDLASLSAAEFYPDGNASVRLVNDTSHLQ
ncbi:MULTISPECIES: bifunctional RNase H/acid phosphatase [unclassified Actinopolyspora]|uniref:bifunctional RNase H/acid phosphatase n=1 Tax=unclassified Actinopolyspora TaxID=2639451 RepID=UPI0013F5E705|nr:bifunctional RNase H/acid phosphatase [Actinopolyspora sp. BKK2]NHE77464.1 bifunctional RNase H/acid phosphatase [Actinopolyspora sp. BKK1]